MTFYRCYHHLYFSNLRKGRELGNSSGESGLQARSPTSHFSCHLPYDDLMRLLLVEDDSRIARFVAKGLREQAYAVDISATGGDALYQPDINASDLVMLHVLIPGLDAFAVSPDLPKSATRIPLPFLP